MKLNMFLVTLAVTSLVACNDNKSSPDSSVSAAPAAAAAAPSEIAPVVYAPGTPAHSFRVVSRTVTVDGIPVEEVNEHTISPALAPEMNELGATTRVVTTSEDKWELYGSDASLILALSGGEAPAVVFARSSFNAERIALNTMNRAAKMEFHLRECPAANLDDGQGENQDKGQDQSKDQGEDKGADQGQDKGQDKDTGGQQGLAPDACRDVAVSLNMVQDDQGSNQGQDQNQGQDKGADQGQDKCTKDCGADQGQDKGADQGQDKCTKDCGADQGQDKGADKGADQGQDKGADKGADQGQDKGQDKGADQGQDKGADKGADQGQDKGQDKGADQGQDKGAGQGKK